MRLSVLPCSYLCVLRNILIELSSGFLVDGHRFPSLKSVMQICLIVKFRLTDCCRHVFFFFDGKSTAVQISYKLQKGRLCADYRIKFNRVCVTNRMKFYDFF